MKSINAYRSNYSLREKTWPTIACIVLFSICSTDISAQDLKAKESLRKGNSFYEDGDYGKALNSYEQANRYDSTYAKAAFNLANAMYQEGDVKEALVLYEEASELFVNEKDKSRAYHNIGRSHLQSALAKIQNMATTGGQPADPSQDPRPDLQASLSGFKESLMLDPNDEEARYNYGYAKKLLEQLPPSQDEQEDQQGDEGDEGDDQDNQEKQEDGPDDKDRNDPDQEKEEDADREKEDQEEKQQPQDPNRMNAEQQLDLLDQEEKELQKQMSKQRMAGNKVRVEKDW